MELLSGTQKQNLTNTIQLEIPQALIRFADSSQSLAEHHQYSTSPLLVLCPLYGAVLGMTPFIGIQFLSRAWPGTVNKC